MRLQGLALTRPADFLPQLPPQLPAGEPYTFLSAQQGAICAEHPELSAYAPHLPGWAPLRRVGAGLGHSPRGIEKALERSEAPFVWATEFENVHTFWSFVEPSFEVEGRSYAGSEDYYQAQKPKPFQAELWDEQRDEVMRRALAYKFGSRASLRELLLSTAPHPLLSLKRDRYWGVDPEGRGQNKLARLLMELRAELPASGLPNP